MSNFPTRHCSECGSPYQSGALRCEWRGHALPRGDANTSLARDLFSFGGRICRQRFWLMGMVINLISVALSVGGGFVSVAFAFLSGSPPAVAFAMFLMISLIWIIPLWWMSLAVWAKRWHDRGKSGWWSLIMLIPIIGPIWALVELGFLKGDYGCNRYGHEDVSSAETVAKWTFWSSLAFAVVLFSVGTWVGRGDELGGELTDLWNLLLYAFLVGHAIHLLYPTVGSLIIWLMSRR